LRSLWVSGLAVALLVPAASFGNNDDDLGQTGKKGSLVVFPHVELRWREIDGVAGISLTKDLIVDTFISLTNDDEAAGVQLKMYFVDGDDCSNVDATGSLTKENPAYWSAFTGRPGLGRASAPQALPSFLAVDPGNPPGHADPEDTDCDPDNPDPAVCDFVCRGYILVWATDATGNLVKHWNHLSGSAAIVSYVDGSVAEYEAYAFQFLHGNEGECFNTDGELDLDGYWFDWAPDLVLLDFYSESDGFENNAFDRHTSGPAQDVDFKTFLTLQVLDADFTTGPTAGAKKTAAIYDIYNQCEVAISGNEFCVDCWISRQLINLNELFDIFFVGTDYAKAEFEGIKDDGDCGIGDTEARAMLGVHIRQLQFTTNSNKKASTAQTLIGLGTEAATIKFRTSGGGSPLTVGPRTLEEIEAMYYGAGTPGSRKE
jgi:hypothetical protein